ncbi:hypothetical protein CA13_56550 [Planctomycetes bacterium CA13]|uniref:Uncharacterized protein n=1 Tax=Novipirellula herctigrandis TaxID=2527986 RepID=A0A5C5Z9Y7_9BACT|nr:hypothetical protein CA13_56550 [Planctomycetes bacterium CA13]
MTSDLQRQRSRCKQDARDASGLVWWSLTIARVRDMVVPLETPRHRGGSQYLDAKHFSEAFKYIRQLC